MNNTAKQSDTIGSILLNNHTQTPVIILRNNQTIGTILLNNKTIHPSNLVFLSLSFSSVVTTKLDIELSVAGRGHRAG